MIDEAHHLHWSEQEAGTDYLFVEQLARLSRGLLLLTATPEQLGQASHFGRLRLLDPDRFHDLASFREEEAGFAELNQRLTTLENSAAADADIDDLLDRHGTGRVLFRNTREGVAGFPQRVLHTYALPLDTTYSDGSALHPELSHEESQWLELDPRVQWLEETVKSLRPEKVLIICAHASTALSLEHHLHLRAGIRSAAFYEGLSIIERDRAAAYFADEEAGAQALVCSEIGSEGRNFQFAHHLILFDLPLNPDLLEQRIGRLDRIGQTRDVQIHVPYLEGSAQDVLLRWYRDGINVFSESCSAGFAIAEQFDQQLQQQLLHRDSGLDSLIEATAAFTAQTRAELREGRDRLLERNSCKPDIAAGLIEAIEENEQTEALEHYLEALCESYGVEQEYHSEAAQILRPSEHMLTGYFPGLREEGTSLTFDRNKALSREDLEFLTWEHPIVVESMDMVLSSELGNAAIATIKLRGIPAGTMLLETIYSINCAAPRELQLERFLPMTPIRLLVDARGKDLSELVAHERLNELCEKIKKQTALDIIKQVHTQVEQKMEKANSQAETRMQTHLSVAREAADSGLTAEVERLRQLQVVNPNIREEEIEHLQANQSACLHQLNQATLQLQALRLIITT